MKQLVTMCVVVAITSVLGSIGGAADIQWTDLGADHLWSTPANWDLGRVPTFSDEVRIDVPAAADPNGPIIQDGINAEAFGILTEAVGQPTLTITGGSLDVSSWVWWGDGAGSFAVWNMSGGTVNVPNAEFELGWGGGAGTLNMTGGTINASELIIPTGTGAFGELYLHGGTYNVTAYGGLEVNVDSNGMIDIGDGTLVLQGDETGKIQGLINNGGITGFGGLGTVYYTFDDPQPGMTTVWAISPTILTWDGSGDGSWDSDTQWSGGQPGDVPHERTPTIVLANTVTATADAAAASLSIEGNGRVVIPENVMLPVALNVQIDDGVLEIAAFGALQASGEVRFAEGSQFVCQVGQGVNGMILAAGDSGNIVLDPGSSLQFQVSGESMFKAGVYALMLAGGTGGISGEFGTVGGLGNYVSAGPAGHDLDYSADTLILTILADLNPGDADLSTQTDLTDFNIWNANKFMSDTGWTTGDFDGDGTTDLSDFNIWNAYKFTVAGGGAAPAPTRVPEPGTLMLLIVAAAIACVHRLRRRSA